MQPPTISSKPPSAARLPRTVILLGFTSFLTDIGSEMIFPLLPVFIASLGGAPTFVGLIEGVADATSAPSSRLRSTAETIRMPAPC